MAIKFLKPKTETVQEEKSEGLKYNVDGNGVVDNVENVSRETKSVTDEKPKNKGGRPRGSGKKAQPLDVEIPIDLPDVPRETNETPAPKNKGGRPRKNQQKGSSFNKEAFAVQFMGMHKVAGMMIPGIDMDMDRARMVADQFEVMKEEWGFEPNGKITSLLGFIGAVAIAEAANFQTMKRARNEAIAKQRAQQKVVTKVGGVEAGNPLETPKEVVQPIQVSQEVYVPTHQYAEGEPLRG